MSHNIPSYLLASGLIAVGFNWVQAIILIALANLIVLIPDAAQQPCGDEVRHPLPGVRPRVVRALRARGGRHPAHLHGDQGAPVWDPIQLSSKFHSPVVIAFALFTVVVATLSVNVAANAVAPSYDFSNLRPRLISFRTGSLITGVIGVPIQPWRLLSNPHVYIYLYGGLLGAVAGVLIADYWWVRRTELRLAQLYQPQKTYWYDRGWNWRAVVALGIGAPLAEPTPRPVTARSRRTA
jgi:cytosine/uracil/thiamine/allantoin permease